MPNKVSAGYSLVDFAGDFDNLFAHLFLVDPKGNPSGEGGGGHGIRVNTDTC